jgi:hypothetical protein
MPWQVRETQLNAGCVHAVRCCLLACMAVGKPGKSTASPNGSRFELDVKGCQEVSGHCFYNGIQLLLYPCLLT